MMGSFDNYFQTTYIDSENLDVVSGRKKQNRKKQLQMSDDDEEVRGTGVIAISFCISTEYGKAAGRDNRP